MKLLYELFIILKVVIITILIAIFAYYFYNKNKEIDYLNMELQTLRDYKRTYLDHVDSCHSSTIHQHCFRIGR